MVHWCSSPSFTVMDRVNQEVTVSCWKTRDFWHCVPPRIHLLAKPLCSRRSSLYRDRSLAPPSPKINLNLQQDHRQSSGHKRCQPEHNMATKLSNELLDAILADLKTGDLVNLVKTHRIFYNSAQRYLFHSVDIPAQSTTVSAIFEQQRKSFSVRWMSEQELEIALERDPHRKPSPKPEDRPILPPVPQSQIPQDIVASEAYGKVTARQHIAALLLQAFVAEPTLADLVRNVHLNCEWSSPLFVNIQAYEILRRTG
jgi:hypothetical protein